MSALYYIMPIKHEFRESMNEFLANFETEIPVGTNSREPTTLEICQVLSEMTDYTKICTVLEKDWNVNTDNIVFYDQSISGFNSEPKVLDAIFNLWSTLHFYFDGNWREVNLHVDGNFWQVNLEIVLRLTRFIGPVVLMCDTVPLLVSPSDNLTDLANQWKRNSKIA